jgi:hypothetical protein
VSGAFAWWRIARPPRPFVLDRVVVCRKGARRFSPLSRMPSRPRFDQFAAALAATKAPAYLRHEDRLRQGVNVHVRLVSASLTGRDNHADAVLAHVPHVIGGPGFARAAT